jgi:hypothetical protein
MCWRGYVLREHYGKEELSRNHQPTTSRLAAGKSPFITGGPWPFLRLW